MNKPNQTRREIWRRESEKRVTLFLPSKEGGREQRVQCIKETNSMVIDRS